MLMGCNKNITCILALFCACCWRVQAEDKDANTGFIGGAWNKIRSMAGKAVSPVAKKEDVQFATVAGPERKRLLRMARCANAAYRDVEIPEGYIAFSGSDWDAMVLGRHYEGCRYDENGYVDIGSGMRARIMFAKTTGDVVVAFSGCDIYGSASEGGRDVVAVASHWWGKVEGQYKQALDIFNGLLLSYPTKRFEVVGHSLGGGLTTFVVAACSDSKERVTGATFDGLGISTAVRRKHITPWREARANKCLVNVKGSLDPVFVIPGTHYGPVYNVKYDVKLCDPHSLDELISQMESANSH